jgi:uncharacterized membrane protein
MAKLVGGLLAITLLLGLVLGIFCLLALCVQFLWEIALVPQGAGNLTFREALALLILCDILFKSRSAEIATKIKGVK